MKQKIFAFRRLTPLMLQIVSMPSLLRERSEAVQWNKDATKAYIFSLITLDIWLD